MGNRCVDIEGFPGDAPTLVGADRIQRAHVVQPIGQFDQDHADVARHRQQHLAKTFRLLLSLGREIEPIEFRKPVDEIRDFVTKFLDQLLFRDTLILHHIMQERGAQGIHVKLPARTNFGYRDRVGNVG